MNVDVDTLVKIKEYRAQNDPPIPHGPTSSWLESSPDFLLEAMVDARIQRLEETPDDERIELATWPETLIYCFTASMDERYVGPNLVVIYRHALEQFLASSSDDNEDVEGMLPPLAMGGIPQEGQPGHEALQNNPEQLESLRETGEYTFTEKHQELVDGLRRTIKETQDELFLEEEYDELPFDTSGVPKVFWKDAAMSTSESDAQSTEDDSQAALDMF